MNIRIALAGNPNSGKTTLFNALTGSNQFVGNWPGVTVEKKEGKLKKHNGVTITDLPGIYSLSPYTLEEVVARNYLIGERPDAILNIVDGTNLERNLYLTTQLTELGIPVVIAINMMDVVRKNGDKINTAELSRELGCKVIEISALKGTGVMEAAEAAIKAAEGTKTVPMHTFSGPVEHALAHIEEVAVHQMPEEQQRWYAIKIFERDEKAMAQLKLSADVQAHIEEDIKAAEKELDDDAESIITNERYVYIASLMKGCYKKKNAGKLTASDKIDRVVTNRWLALPIFALVMCLVYYVSVTTVGSWATDWTNDGLVTSQQAGQTMVYSVMDGICSVSARAPMTMPSTSTPKRTSGHRRSSQRSPRPLTKALSARRTFWTPSTTRTSAHLTKPTAATATPSPLRAMTSPRSMTPPWSPLRIRATTACGSPASRSSWRTA
jgi:ferrous iron transport protein B